MGYSYCNKPCPEYPTGTSASCECQWDAWIKGSFTKDSSTYSYCYNPCPEYPQGTSANCECERDDWSKGRFTEGSKTYSYCYDPANLPNEVPTSSPASSPSSPASRPSNSPNEGSPASRPRQVPPTYEAGDSRRRRRSSVEGTEEPLVSSTIKRATASQWTVLSFTMI